MKYIIAIVIVSLLLGVDAHANSQGMVAFTATPSADGATTYSLSLKILAAMTFFTLLPALLMAATSFTRIIIVLAILRQAMGMPNIPTNQVLIGLTLMITLFIMSPVFKQVNDDALQPYLDNKISDQQAIEATVQPFKDFMLKQTRHDDLDLFAKMSSNESYQDPQELPIAVVMTSFVTSELKTAFQIGFLLFIPFLIIDLVVASILMSMGMMMLSPLVISLPFKIMLFVLVNGWALVIGSLSTSFAF